MDSYRASIHLPEYVGKNMSNDKERVSNYMVCAISHMLKDEETVFHGVSPYPDDCDDACKSNAC